MTLPAPPDWSKRAACVGQVSGGRDPWHPPDGPAGLRARLFDRARRICLDCPVQAQCVRYGMSLLAAEPVEGMYGGLTPPELRALARRLERRATRAAQHGTRSAYVGGCRCGDCRRANTEGEHERRVAAG